MQDDPEGYREKRAAEQRDYREVKRAEDENKFNLKRAAEKQAGCLKASNSVFKRKQGYLDSIRDGLVYVCISCHRKLHKSGVTALKEDWEEQLEQKFQKSSKVENHPKSKIIQS